MVHNVLLLRSQGWRKELKAELDRIAVSSEVLVSKDVSSDALTNTFEFI